MLISSQLRQKYVNFMTNGIKHVIDTYDKRASCSKGERDTQMYFKSQMSNYMDEVISEDFTCHPASFMGWINITVTCMLLGLVAYFFIPIVSIFLFLIGAFCMISQLILYKEWIDPLFKKKSSCNVYAKKAPAGEIKRRIVLCGHTDAAYEWHWHYKFGCAGFYGVLGGSIVGSLMLCIFSIIKLAGGQFMGVPLIDKYFWMGIAIIPFALFFIACYKYSDTKTVVDGANDNLTACYMSIAVAKLLNDQKISLKNTELCILLAGCEEAGLRGSRAWCKAHKADYNDVETIFLCYETLRDENHLSCYKSEIFGFYKTDEKVANFIADAGKEHGKDIRVIPVSVGTDSAAFGEYGLRSTCLAALDEVKIGRYYHTRMDTYDNLNPDLLGDILDISLTAIDKYDKNGLNV